MNRWRDRGLARLVVLGLVGSLVAFAEPAVGQTQGDEVPALFAETVDVVDPTGDVPVFGVEEVAVAVFPVDAAGSVTIEVDGVEVGSEVITGGMVVIDWDTTGFDDGEYELAAIAFDIEGVEAASHSATVEVANALDDLDRIMADFDRGLLTVDEFAVLATESIYVPNRLPDRYLSGVTDDVDSEGTVAVLTIEELADQLSEDTLGLLAAYEAAADMFLLPDLRSDPDLDPRDLVGDLVEGSEPEPTGFSVSQHSPHWQGCDANAGCEFATEHFRIFFTLASVNVDDGVPDDPATDDAVAFDPVTGALAAGGNGVPDRIDNLAFELERALALYIGPMGYDDPPGISFGPFAARIEVRVQDGREFARRGVAPFGIGDVGYMISVGPASSRYTVRHELFHHVQFGYFDVQWFLPGTPWWLESSAQWAAHAAGEQLGDNIYGPGTFDDGEAGRYGAVLPAFLGTPGERLTSGEELFTFSEPRVYGAFIMSEYFEVRFDAEDIRGVWERVRTNPIQGAAWAVWTYDYDGETFGEVLADFWSAAYLLSDQADHPLNFNDGHLDSWRAELGPNDTGGDAGSPLNRPRRIHWTVTEDWSPDIFVLIGMGGGVFLDLTAEELDAGGEEILSNVVGGVMVRPPRPRGRTGWCRSFLVAGRR